MQSFFSFPASSLFGTRPPVKSPTLPLRKMLVFQGVAPRRTFFTSSCVIPLWESATAHSPSGKEHLLRKMPVFQGIFTSSCVIPLWDSATARRNIRRKYYVYHKKVSDYTTFALMIT